MSTAHLCIRPNTWLCLRLPSDSLKLVEIKPNTIIDIGKLGSFPSSLLLGRPYYYTYELLEKRDGEAHSRLRFVSHSELNADIVAEDDTPIRSRGEPETAVANGTPDVYDLVGEDGTVIMKNNRLTIDDASRQALSQQDIEELKKSSGGKEIMSKILANHTGLDEKTAFSKAKYTLRKAKKYLKRFMVLPIDIGSVMEYVMEKEPSRIMELREETLGLIMAWSDAHYSDDGEVPRSSEGKRIGGGRWLVAEETGGLVVAAMAARMGILYHQENDRHADTEAEKANGVEHAPIAIADGNAQAPGGSTHTADKMPENQSDPSSKPTSHRDFPLPAAANTIILLHPAVQPNLSLLKYFGYDTNQPDSNHPLHTHLKPLSWLQMLHPNEDPTYREPEHVPESELQTWKSGKRGTYWKKRRRWERCRSIVDETREGGFEGLVVVSNMDPATILPHSVPLVRGGGHVVVYSPTAEPLVKLIDLYSKNRRSAYINHLSKGETPDLEDFPVDPRLLLAPTLQTSRVREWQVLPGRTHPLMTGRGGAEGYVFTARKVVPLTDGVEARGNFVGKKRKVDQVVEAEPVTAS